MATITVVGSFCVDILIRANRMPVWGETLLGRDFYIGPGGKGGNQAAGVAKLGAETYFVTAVGRDQFGDMAFNLAKSLGIRDEFIARIDEMTTSIGFGLLDPAGRSACITDLAALSRMDAAFVDRAENVIARSGAVLTMLENPLEAAARAMELGRKHGVLTILNPAPAVELDASVLRNCDIVTPNETELRVLLRLQPDDATKDEVLVERLRQRGAKTVVMTRGEKGALVAHEMGLREVKAISVNVVDTTGAGDAFNAALAVALAEGLELMCAVEFAACAGAIACTKLGSIPALGDRKAVEVMWRENFS